MESITVYPSKVSHRIYKKCIDFSSSVTGQTAVDISPRNGKNGEGTGHVLFSFTITEFCAIVQGVTYINRWSWSVPQAEIPAEYLVWRRASVLCRSTYTAFMNSRPVRNLSLKL
jgi:hypothetical protein